MAGLQKTSGGLFEVSNEELDKQQAAALSPTTPAGAASRGASEDSAKMFGTSAQKNAAQKQILQPQQTLQQAQRERQTIPDAQQEMFSQNVAKEKLNRIKSLGGIDSQLESMIQQRITNFATQQSNQAQLQLNNTSVEALSQGLDVANKSKLNSQLNNFKTAIERGDNILLDTALAQMSGILGRPITKDEAMQLFQSAGGTLGAQAAQALTPSTITMGQLNLQELGQDPAQIEQDLGLQPGQLANMTYEQFQQAIQAAESNEYNKVQNLEAELQTAVGARREQILRELGQLTQAGTTGVEAEFDRLQKEIDEGKTINVLGQQMSLDDILSSDEWSEVIENAASSEEEFNRLKASHPELAAWVDTNKQMLNKLKEDMSTGIGNFQETQDKYNSLRSTMGDKLFKAVVGEDDAGFVTAQEMAEIIKKLNDNSVYKLMQTNDYLAQKVKDNPELFKSLGLLDESTLEKSIAYSQFLEGEGSGIASLLGLEPGAFPTDKATMEKIDLLSSIPTDITARPEFQQLYNRHKFNDKQLQEIASNPESFDGVVNYFKMEDEINKIGGDFDKMVNFLFGGMSQDSLNKNIAELKEYANAGDENAKKQLDAIKDIVGNDLVLDKSDKSRMDKFISQNKGNINDVIKGGDIFKGYDVNALQSGLAATPEAKRIAELNRTGWNQVELNTMSAGELDRLYNNKQFQSSNPDAYNKVKFAKIAQSISDKVVSDYGMVGGFLEDGKVTPKELKEIENMVRDGSIGIDTYEQIVKSGILKVPVKGWNVSEKSSKATNDKRLESSEQRAISSFEMFKKNVWPNIKDKVGR